MSVPASNRAIPRQLKPELEREFARSPDLGYETPDAAGFVRCLSHGFPTPLARWHYHDEYELHLITETSGKAFVGDWIGPFQPGHLVLTGPRLPHNWLSLDTPEDGVPFRDLVIQFDHEPLVQSAALIPELAELGPLLERARHGIEFFGMGERSEQHWYRVKQATGLRRLTAFFDLMCDLATCTDYRLLSSVQLQSDDDDTSLDQIHGLVSRITDNLSEHHSAAAIAAGLEKTPKPLPGTSLSVTDAGKTLKLAIHPPEGETRDPAGDLVFPETPQVIDPAAVIRFAKEGNLWTAEAPKSEYLSGMPTELALVIVNPNTGNSFRLTWSSP